MASDDDPGWCDGQRNYADLSMRFRGFVYVMTNFGNTELLKIGYSMRDPEIRAREMENEGHPHAPNVLYWALVTAPRVVEARVHEVLEDNKERKEWFRLELRRAIEAIRLVAGKALVVDSVGYHSAVPTPPASSANTSGREDWFQFTCKICSLGRVSVQLTGEKVSGVCDRCRRSSEVSREYVRRYATPVSM